MVSSGEISINTECGSVHYGASAPESEDVVMDVVTEVRQGEGEGEREGEREAVSESTFKLGTAPLTPLLF
ncbi:hypothetical protein KIPB_015431, partial [Kipferlia bialata]|eukprot:g15431.t1